jgi:hypothetical protein
MSNYSKLIDILITFYCCILHPEDGSVTKRNMLTNWNSLFLSYVHFDSWLYERFQLYCLTHVGSWITEFKKRQALYIAVASLNHLCRGNIMSITYFECVSVALVTQHATCTLRIFICGPSGSKTFPNYLINGTIFGKSYWKYEYNVCFEILYISCLKPFTL